MRKSREASYGRPSMGSSLAETARALVAGDKGVLAMDESTPTCDERFAALGIPQTVEVRRAYREMIVTTPHLSECINGAILFDETIRQETKDGARFVDVLSGAGIMPGIKVDTGSKELALHPGEHITEGLDGVRDRLAEYSRMGVERGEWLAARSGARGEKVVQHRLPRFGMERRRLGEHAIEVEEARVYPHEPIACDGKRNATRPDAGRPICPAGKPSAAQVNGAPAGWGAKSSQAPRGRTRTSPWTMPPEPPEAIHRSAARSRHPRGDDASDRSSRGRSESCLVRLDLLQSAPRTRNREAKTLQDDFVSLGLRG
jgi:Fructose-bisphosphate aldolase class-I